MQNVKAQKYRSSVSGFPILTVHSAAPEYGHNRINTNSLKPFKNEADKLTQVDRG